MVQFACVCGKRLQCPDDAAAKAVRCPGCSQVVRVPNAAIPVAMWLPVAEEAARTPPTIPEPTASPTVQSWVYPPKHENFLVALDHETFWCYSQIFTSVRPAHEQLVATGAPGEVLGKEALRIPVAMIHKLELDKKRSNLVLLFREKNKKEKWVERRREFFFDDAVMRDAIFAALRQRLGTEWSVREEQLTPLNAALPYLFIMVLTVLAVPLLLFLVHWLQGDYWFEQVGGGLFFRIGRAVIHFVQDVLRWSGVVIDCLVIGAGVCLCIAWVVLLISHVRMPPLLWHLEKAPVPTIE